MASVDGSSSPGESSGLLLPGEYVLGLQVIALSLGFTTYKIWKQQQKLLWDKTPMLSDS